MTSHKQLIANRSNALKSTGPRTEEWKAIVCQNAMKHGILCQEIPIDETESVSFDEFSSRLFIELNPVGEFEQFIVDRIISSAWRLRRVINIETALYRSELNPTLILDEEPSISDAFRGPSKDRMVVLPRYEIAIERSLYRALEELMKLQAIRQGLHMTPQLVKIGFVSQNQEMESHAKADESFHVTANMVLSLDQRSREIFESSEVDEKRQLLNFVFQNLELKDKKLSIQYRQPFKMIKDTSLAGKCPGMCRSQDSFRTFKEFD